VPSIFLPQDHGLESWSQDPYSIQAGTNLVNGRVYLEKLMLRRRFTVSRGWFSISAVATTPTAGQNFVGIATPDGVWRAVKGIDNELLSTGVQGVLFDAPVDISDPFVWLGVLVNAVGVPALHRFSGSGTPQNANLTAPFLRSAALGGAVTSLTNFDPTTLSGTNNLTIWAAVS
jgi:hypothetical protein